MERLTIEMLDGITLGNGSHRDRDAGVCAMEAVAWLAGEPHSDAPQCACPVLAGFVRSLNDALPDADRTRILRPLVPRLVGTRSTPDVELRRSCMALDWLIRIHTPAWLDLTESLRPHAAALRALPEIRNLADAEMAGPVVRDAHKASDAAWAAAWAAAGDAARAAARDAAGDAARAAARAAAWDAAGDAAWAATRAAAWAAARAAAWDAAGDAARDAARAAAWDAAGDAAWDATRAAAWDAARAAAWDAAWAALASTVAALRESAADLLSRMIDAA